MVNTLLIIWSMFATFAVVVAGAWIALSPHGETWPGVALALMGGLLGVACVQLGREQWGWYRRRHAFRHEIVERPVVRRRPAVAADAKAQPPRRPAKPRPAARANETRSEHPKRPEPTAAVA